MKAHCLPFSQIPHTTRLFSDFLAYSPTVQRFYPRSPQFGEWVKEEAGEDFLRFVPPGTRHRGVGTAKQVLGRISENARQS